MSTDQEPLITPNNALQRYYASLESRIGYRLLLGGTRHFGYYDADTYWPFPISSALRRMEDQLFATLSLQQGARVLDAGCGVGHVAIHLAHKGLRVQGIDVVDRHLARARRNIAAAGVAHVVSVRKMDYHHLDALPARSFDGAYTMETLVHAADAEAVLAGLRRVLKPGGTVAFHEYEHDDSAAGANADAKQLEASMLAINEYAAMPANTRFRRGALAALLVEAGFEEVQTRDLSEHVMPMLRLFFVLAYIPYLLIALFGLQPYFVNAVAAVETYRARRYWSYAVVSARKPLRQEGGEGVRERKPGAVEDI